MAETAHEIGSRTSVTTRGGVRKYASDDQRASYDT